MMQNIKKSLLGHKKGGKIEKEKEFANQTHLEDSFIADLLYNV